MKIKKTRKKVIKIIRIALISSACLLVVTCLSIYLLIHGYIQKMNLVKSDEAENNISPTQAVAIITSQPVTQTDTGEEQPVMGKLQGMNGLPLQDQPEVNNQSQSSPVPTQTQHIQTNNQNQSGQDKGVKNENNQISDDGSGQKSIENDTLMEDDKIMNLLLIGIDAKEIDASYSNESIVLFTVNKKTKKLITTTLLNNIYLQIPGGNKDRLINAYRSGGAQLLVDTIEHNFKFKIDGYVMADYNTYIDIVDTIGGVSIDVSEDELEPLNINIRDLSQQIGDDPESDLISAAGTYLFNGKQALAYSRNWFNKDDEYLRPGKQKEVIMAIIDKVKKFGFIEMNGFLNEVLPHITTNLSESEIFELIFVLPSYFDYGLDQWSLPVAGTQKKLKRNGKTVLDIDLEKNIEAVYAKLYNIE